MQPCVFMPEFVSEDRAATEVLPHLWVGGILAVVTIPEDVHLWISCAKELGPRGMAPATLWLKLEERALTDAEKCDVKHVADRICTAGDGRATVAVTCAEGRNRSCFVVAAALIRLGWTVDQAVGLLREKRPGAIAIPEFIECLREFAATPSFIKR